MDKILKRTSYAKAYVARRKIRDAAGRAKLRRSLSLNQQKQLATERKRREDWFLGPIAPRRDAGQDAETYGTLSARLAQGGLKIKKTGKTKNQGIYKGDRVVITDARHRDRGKIGVVRQVRGNAHEVFVEKLNMVCMLSCPSISCHLTTPYSLEPKLV